jgi:SAM-dependent methyltransferase
MSSVPTSQPIIGDSGFSPEWEAYLKSPMPSMIGSYHLCHTLFAMQKTGMAALLRMHKSIPIADLLAGLDARLGELVLRYLCLRGVVSVQGGAAALTPLGRTLLDEVSMAQLGFYVEAYGPVTGKLSDLLQGAEYGRFVSRDAAALGRHCATIWRHFHVAVVTGMLKCLSAMRILDLGCGAGRLILDICASSPHIEGVGLDISREAVDLAEKTAKVEALEGRAKFLIGDAFKPASWPIECQNVDAIIALGVLHEHFRMGEQQVVSILNTYAELMERHDIKALILGEPELHYDNEQNDSDFYLAHIVTNQGFPRRLEEWTELLSKTKLQVMEVRRPTGGPRFSFFCLIPKQANDGARFNE